MSRDQRGLTKLEWLGVIGLIALLLAMIPFVRDGVQDLVGRVYARTDAAGELTDFSVMMRGVTILAGAIVVFIGAMWFILSTNIGRRLSFLLVGTAAFGWLTIGGVLFVVYAPRGLRPADIEDLNAVQMRVPAIALALGAFILFLMFLLALNRYEAEE
jgi:hypothetical protein